MTANQLISRKFEAGLSDLQMLVLLTLGDEMASLTDLAESMGRPVSTVCGACAAMIRLEFLAKDAPALPYQPCYYFLTDTGKQRVKWLLGR